ncbi:MAG: hypothetical protein US50_C0044G0011, partial [Candidatus Nomurabacteria bacterium GW2011_GWB1_37_5]
MPEALTFKETPKFKSPEEELSFLRGELERREKELTAEEVIKTKEEVAKEVIQTYKEVKPEQVLPAEKIIPKAEAEKIVLRLTPEPHDKKMEELLAVLMQKGIKNAMSLAEGFNNPHIDDDFHRFLVEYLHTIGNIPGLKEGTPLDKALKMTLFEITLPEQAPDKEKGFKEFLGAMEQFYAGMQSMADNRDNWGKNYFTLEVALSNNASQVVVYAAVPTAKKDLFEKQILAFYSDAKVHEVVDDYNIFNESGGSVGAYAKLYEAPVLPIRTYDKLEHDPINSILNIFSKLKHEGEGAAIQFVVTPAGDKFTRGFTKVLSSLKEGKTLKQSMEVFSAFDRQFGRAVKELIFGVKKKEEKEKKIDDIAVEKVSEKIKSTIVNSTIRIIASAENEDRANQIVTELESSFNQFSEPGGNSFTFSKIKGGELKDLLHEFAFRLPSEKENIALNLKELSTVFHFPIGVGQHQLKMAKAGIAPAPFDMPTEGIILGYNEYRGVRKEIRMTPDDRMRHLYVIGQTGTGKSTILVNMMIQDIINGDGCCFIDPHGSDVQSILSYIPKERIDDVIYFEPTALERPFGLNFLEFDPKYPEQRGFLINELLSIFKQLYGKGSPESMGPAFEQYFRNSTRLVMEHPESGNTLLEISRVLTDDEFRAMKLANAKDPILKQFWEMAEKTTGEGALANYGPYITNKFDSFLTNDIMRPIVLQEKSSFNIREIMDNKKILLVNLAKGKLGEINANLLGLILVSKIQMAALSRVDMFGKKMSDFYLYIDEFQNVTTDSIASILSEARKYRLSLNVAHQFIAQLQDNIKDAVFGNVGSTAVYRVSTEDAEYLAKRYEPTFHASDIMKLDMFTSYVNMLVRGVPVKPFNMFSDYKKRPQNNESIGSMLKHIKGKLTELPTSADSQILTPSD